jgi:pimeloyl-ACP methyl ester carboxylesterase
LVTRTALAALAALSMLWLVTLPERPHQFEGNKRQPAFNGTAGWYESESGDQLLASPSAQGGLYFADFERPTSARVTRSATGLEWTSRDDKAPMPITIHWAEDGRVSGFEWMGRTGPTTLSRMAEPPYRIEEIFFENETLELSGTVMIPCSPGPFPGAVFIHGSGDSDRDNLWYQTIAHRLAMAGFAVLLPDKRGTGKSDGDWRVASFGDFAEDALVGVAALASRPDTDARAIGLIGVSQGGWIAPLAATAGGSIAFVVNLSGATVTPRSQLLHESRATLKQAGVPSAVSWVLGIFTSIVPQVRRARWWGKNGSYDPIPHWASLRVPGLILLGSQDEDDNVPVQRSVTRVNQIDEIQRPEVKVFDGVGHGFMDSRTGRIREDVLAYLIEWVLSSVPMTSVEG